MQIISAAEDGTLVKLTPLDTQVLGAFVWLMLEFEKDNDNLYKRFYPNGEAPMSEEAFYEHYYSLRSDFRAAGVDMG